MAKPFILRTPEGKPYEPHEAQLRFHQATEKFRWYGGGKGGGKTIAAAAEAILTMLRYPGSKGVVLLRDYRHLEETAWEHLRLMIRATCNGDISRLVRQEHTTTNDPMILFHNGSVVHGWNNQDAMNKGGLRLSWFWVDEAHLADDNEAFIELGNRLRHDVGPRRGWMTGYVTGFDWQQDLFIKKGLHTHKFIEADTFDNLKNLPDDYLDTFLGYSEEKKLQYMHGKFIESHGGVLHFWKDHWHRIDPFAIPESWPRYRAIDPGISHPFCCLWFTVDDMGNVYVYREYLVTGINIERAVHEVLRLSEGETIEWTAIDPNAAGQTLDSVAKRRIELFYDAGMTNILPSDNNIDTSIAQIQNYLFVDPHRRYPLYDLAGRLNPEGNIMGSPRLFVMSCCTNLLSQIPNWRYGKDGKPKKGNDDAIAALRYGMMSRFRNATVNDNPKRNPLWLKIMEDIAGGPNQPELPLIQPERKLGWI